MYSNKTRKILIVLLALALATVMFAGCGSDDSADNAPAPEEEVKGDIKVTLDIDFPDSSGEADIEDKVVGLPADSSVMDLLFAYANENNLVIETDGEDDPYVVSINGVKASGESGWVFEVNDEPIMEAAGKTMLKDGDEVSWEYTSWSEEQD